MELTVQLLVRVQCPYRNYTDLSVYNFVHPQCWTKFFCFLNIYSFGSFGRYVIESIDSGTLRKRGGMPEKLLIGLF